MDLQIVLVDGDADGPFMIPALLERQKQVSLRSDGFVRSSRSRLANPEE